jgi:hypothetical protein
MDPSLNECYDVTGTTRHKCCKVGVESELRRSYIGVTPLLGY